jgi:hypothetical protein
MAFSWDDMRMFLGPEVNTAVSLAEGEDPMAALGNYAIGQGISYGVNSGADALHGATGDVDAATKQFADAGMVSPGATDSLGNVSQEQLYNDAINIPTTAQFPQQPTIANSGLPDSGIVGQGGQVKLDNNALNSTIPQQGIDITNSQPTGVQLNDNAYQSINTPSGATNPLPDYQFDGYTDSGSPSVDTPKEAPGTFLGLEGKDYTKMGMQGVMAAGLSSLKPTQAVQSKAQVGEGITKGKVMQPQGGMQGVNSMVAPDPRLNSMQMTQAQGLLNPFQRDRYRRGQY